MSNVANDYTCPDCEEPGMLNEYGLCPSCHRPCAKCHKAPCAGTLVWCGKCVAEEMSSSSNSSGDQT